MRAARIRVPRALHDRKTAFVEYLAESHEARMQAEGLAAAVAADLQHLACGNGDRRTAARVERIQVRHQRAQRVVAAAQIHHDEVAAARALRQRNVAQERGGRKAYREGGDPLANEFPARDLRHLGVRLTRTGTRTTRRSAWPDPRPW